MRRKIRDVSGDLYLDSNQLTLPAGEVEEDMRMLMNKVCAAH